MVQLGGAAPVTVSSPDGLLSLPAVADGTYALTLSLPPWEERVPSLTMTSGKAFIVDGTAAPLPLGVIELQRAHRLASGTSEDLMFDVSPDKPALVYRQYAKSAGTASFVQPAEGPTGGTPVMLATGWLSQAFFVENGRRVALVTASGETLVDASIDLIEPGTGVRTPLATAVLLGLGPYNFAPERFAYYRGSTGPQDLVVERLDVGDRFVVKDVNNVWRQSPDKGWLAVYTATGGLRTVNLSTGAIHLVSAGPISNFELTADSRRVVFSDQISVYSADVATGTVTTLAQSNEYLLSPDGRLVLVQPSISSPLQVVPVTGGAAVTVTVDVTTASVPTNRFSTDGAYMFFQTNNAFKAASTAKLDVQILSTSTNGRLVDYVPATKTVYFTADGAFVQGRGQTQDFFRMPLDHTGSRETLARSVELFSGPFASPSGRYVTFAASDGSAGGPILKVIDTTTGAQTRIAYVTTGEVTFSPDESWLFFLDAKGMASLARLSDATTFPIGPGPTLGSNAKFSPSGDRVVFPAGEVLVTAPVAPCPLPTFVARYADFSSVRWVGDRALAFLRSYVPSSLSFVKGLYLAPVP